MPRANAKNYTINIAPNANFFALPEFVISHTSKIPAAIAKNFIHYIHSFLLDYSITHKARFVNSFFEIYNILWEIKSEYIIYFLCCKNLVYYILFQIWFVNWHYEPSKIKESLPSSLLKVLIKFFVLSSFNFQFIQHCPDSIIFFIRGRIDVSEIV